MTMEYSKIGFVGGGNMAEAFIGALLQSKIFRPEQMLVSDVLTERLRHLEKTYGIVSLQDNAGLYDGSNLLLLAVKPQQMNAVLTDIADRRQPGRRERKLILSIAAGFPIRKIEKALYAGLNNGQEAQLPIIRIMPNTPALVLAGMSGMSANRYATEKDRQQTKTILNQIGAVIEFDEKDLDAVTAVSGSGPAYVFYMVEAMVAAGQNVGLSRENALALTLQTLEGAVKLLRESQEPPEQLRRKVTSPGGTTEAALGVLEAFDFKKAIVEAIAAAARRADELSR